MRALVLSLALLLSPVALWSAAPAPVLATTHRLESEGVCSGTAVGPHALLTAHHCGFTTKVKVDGFDRNIKVVENDGNDHDILIVDGPAFASVASFAPAHSLQPGDDVWICGNPAGIPFLVRRGSYEGQGGSGYDLFDINGFFGDSGAAIFDSSGRIVGTVSQIGVIPVSKEGVTVIFKTVVGHEFRFTPAQLAEAARS